MSVEYSERWSDRKLSRSKGSDGAANWTAVRAWDVVGTTNEAEAINAVLDAGLGQPHDISPVLKVSSHATERVGLQVIKVTANYTIPIEGSDGDKSDRDGDGNTDTPSFSNIPAEYMFGEQEEQEVTDRDAFGRPIVNSAGEAFDGGSTFPLKTFLYTVTIWQPYYDVKVAAKFLNTINDNPWVTPFGVFGDGEVLFNSVVPVESFIKGQKWIKVTYSFKIRLRSMFPGIPAGASPWDRRFLDKGLNGFADVDGANVLGPICGKNGKEVQRDVRLNGKGVPIEDGYTIDGGKGKKPGKDGKEPTAPAIERSDAGGVKAVFLWYRVYAREDFKKLDL